MSRVAEAPAGVAASGEGDGGPGRPWMRPWMRWSPWVVLVAAAAVALGIGLRPAPARPTLDAQVTHIASELKCPVCSGETVAESSAAPSVQIRDEIRQDLINGERPAQIIAGFEASYGRGILETPPARGVGVLVWLLPVVAAAAGALGVLLAVRRWRRSPAGPAADAGPVDPVAEAATADPVAEAATADLVAEAATADLVAEAATADLVAEAATADPVAPGAVSEAAPSAAIPRGPAANAPPANVPPARPRRRARLLVSCAGVLLIAAGTAWVLVGETGHRLPGEEITGQVLGADQVEADLSAAQSDEQRNPPDVTGAVKEYQAVLAAVPEQVDALTGEGWLLVQTDQPALVQKGLGLLQQAEKVDPSYGPAHVYRGLALLGEGDYRSSVPELQWYLDHNPDPGLAPGVRKALAEAQSGAETEGPPSTGG